MNRTTTTELLGQLNTVETKNAPTELFYAGSTNLLQDYPCVSVVGSRKVSEAGVKRTSFLTRRLVERGVVIVSGLAEGVDTTAHTTAIKEGGRTVAVLGTPLNEFYPKKNKGLQEQIMEEHLAVSQFPVGTPTRSSSFPMRNRTMALLSHATVIIEAKDKSGTLHQGYEALRLGRPLFVMESLTKDPSLKWPRELIHYGAEPLSKETLDLLFDLLPYGGRSALTQLTL